MNSALWYLPVWVFALGALWLGAGSASTDASLYAGLGGLGITVANALMLQHRRIGALERRIAAAEASRPADG